MLSVIGVGPICLLNYSISTSFRHDIDIVDKRYRPIRFRHRYRLPHCGLYPSLIFLSMGIARYLCKRTRGSSYLDPPRGAVPISRDPPHGAVPIFLRGPVGAVPLLRTRPTGRFSFSGPAPPRGHPIDDNSEVTTLLIILIK